ERKKKRQKRKKEKIERLEKEKKRNGREGCKEIVAPPSLRVTDEGKQNGCAPEKGERDMNGVRETWMKTEGKKREVADKEEEELAGDQNHKLINFILIQRSNDDHVNLNYIPS
ncbi:hypothetical protein PIB30_019370, partial [Stylosanthes scabra]|nr:hypothetical protein [Stylosanthes scabra]